MEKKRILVINNKLDKGYLNNIVKPLIELQEKSNDIHITIKVGCDITSINFNEYDSVIFNKHVSFEEIRQRILYYKSEYLKPKFIYYIEEWWQLPKTHDLYKKFNERELGTKITKVIQSCDLIVTYGNDLLVEEIKKFNYNVVQLKRTEGFQKIKIDTKQPVFGVVPTEYDLENIKLLSNLDFKNTFWENNKIVLVGFTNIGSTYDKVERCFVNKPVTDNVWIEYEKIITDNYKICSEEYKEFLLKFLPNDKYNGNINLESYKRIWKEEIISNRIYYNILLKPLVNNKYNKLLYDVEVDMAENTIIDNKFVQVLNTINYPKLNIKKNIKKDIPEIALRWRQQEMFPINIVKENNNNILKIFK